MNRLAVILFCYKRPRTLKRVLKTHTKINADYYCFIDGSWEQEKVRKIVESKNLYKITAHIENIGLNRNITEGITEIFNKGYDAVIVLEDDILLEEGALEYLQTRLRMLKNDDRFGSVSLQKGKAFNERFYCWGWGTWKHVWEQIDFSKLKDESWDVFLAKWMKDNQLYTRCSDKERVKHIGHFGTHYHWYSWFSVRRLFRWLENYKQYNDVDETAL